MASTRRFALHHAAFIGDLHEVERLIDAGADLEARDDRDETPLFSTTVMTAMRVDYDGRDAVFRLLVERGADLNAVCSNGSILHLVCRGFHPMGPDVRARNERICWLLERGARPVHRDDQGHTVLWVLLPYRDQLTRDLVRTLIARGAELDAADHRGETPLHHAIAQDLDSASFLLELGAATDRADRQGRTPLHALCEGDLDDRQLLTLCDRLLAHHAPIDRADGAGWTPLARAADRGAIELVRALLAAGASPDGTDHLRPLLLAHDGRHAEVFRLLLANGANPGVTFRGGDTLLHWAATNGPLELVQSLISAGAPLEATNAAGATPLTHATRDAKIVAALLAAGADVNAADRYGQTALICSGGRRDVIALLLAHGADPNAARDDGETPIYMARNRGDHETVELLLRHGARDEHHPRLVLRTYRHWLDKVLATASRVDAFGHIANRAGHHYIALTRQHVIHLFELDREHVRGHDSFPLATAQIARLDATATALDVSIEHGGRCWQLEIPRFSMPTSDGEPQTAGEAAAIGEMTGRIEAALVAARDGRLKS